MDLDRVLAELIEERKLIDQAIANLERLSAKAGRSAPRREPQPSLSQKRIREKAKSTSHSD
ncbi:hypothetical protein SBA4_3410005 [Candidatus Sulfopaludibacter sp. SbA4]|nr:hypothetical protein SBA4_3410005 [Candidatus Sulfopaludibacter sp. SbA4]